MKTDFMIALTQLASERNLPRELILKTIEMSLVPIFKKNSFAADQEITVKIIPQTGEVKVYAQKLVVEKKPADPLQEISLNAAKKLKGDVKVGEIIDVESTPENAGRIAAQAARQVISQRLREVERDTIYGEYAHKEGEIVGGTVHYIEPKQILIDLGKTEAILPYAEQVNTEHYRVGQRLKLYLMKVLHTSKGTQLIVSRTHPNLLRRLFELEIPEIYNGTVEIKAIAREPGYRAKIAVAAQQEGMDAVGCCVGLRSIRIQNITRELNNEKIDIVQWHSDPAIFIANALSPASAVKVEVNAEENSANVVVHDKQLSLAIGRGGHNARLTARLTGWRIDIKSQSTVETEEVVKPAQDEEVVPVETAEVADQKEETLPVEAEELEARAEEVIHAEDAVEPETETLPEPAAEEIIPTSEEVEEPVPVPSEVAPPSEPKTATQQRTYSVEEILSEIESATEVFPKRFGDESPTPKIIKPVTTKVKKGKQKSATKAEQPEGKQKPKKAPRRITILEEEDDDTD